MNKSSYYRYIRPQIRTILVDYEKILTELNPKLKNIKSAFNNTFALYKLTTEDLILKEDVQKYSDAILKSLEKAELENKQKLIFKVKKLQKKENYSELDLKEIYNAFNLFILENLDKSYRDQFNLLWLEFISPLRREIMFKNNSKFLTKRLTALNIAWNSFNVHMTKRNVDLPKGTATRLEIIHRRWRSVLKLTVVP